MTREKLTLALSPYIPFEKALRAVEANRVRDKRKTEIRPRKRYTTTDEQIYYGRRALVSQLLSSGVANNRIVVERVPGGGGWGHSRPNDIIRLRREDDPTNPRNEDRKAKARERRERRKRAREAEEAAGDKGAPGRSAA